ncbi:hypothetical protein [Halalkalibacter lacteus]|uniref:hypothetical protein n=1 Tax=Halalkalibacter lacteus TaxID=3090663 RepID=UPI002FC95864
MKKWGLVFLCLFILSACDSLTKASFLNQKPLNEISLSENEEIIFSILAERIFYLDFKDSNKEFRSVEVGVDYYQNGEIVEKNGGLMINANDLELEQKDERARILFTMDREENEGNLSVYGDLKIMYDSGSSGSSSYSLERKGTERGSSSWGYLVDEIEDVTYDKKNYVAYYVENVESNVMRSFDLEVATKPNQDYEHVYMFYVIISDEPFCRSCLNRTF